MGRAPVPLPVGRRQWARPQQKRRCQPPKPVPGCAKADSGFPATGETQTHPCRRLSGKWRQSPPSPRKGPEEHAEVLARGRGPGSRTHVTKSPARLPRGSRACQGHLPSGGLQVSGTLRVTSLPVGQSPRADGAPPALGVAMGRTRGGAVGGARDVGGARRLGVVSAAVSRPSPARGGP